MPDHEDIFLEAESGRQRLNFEATIEETDEEMEKLEEFNEFLDTSNYVVRKQYSFREKYRYLQGCAFDHQKAYDSINNHSKFVAEYLPASLVGVIDLLNSGAF